MKKILLLIITLAVAAACSTATITSPNGRVEVIIHSDSASYDLIWDGDVILDGATAQLILSDSAKAWDPSISPKFSKAVQRTETFDAPLHRQSRVVYTYTDLIMDLGTGFTLEWRLSDDGAAYRFTTSREGETVILDEEGSLRFIQDHPLTCGKSSNEADPYHNSFESYYTTENISEGSTMPILLPASVDLGQGKRLTLAESDVRSYPGSFARPQGVSDGTSGVSINLEYAPHPGENFIVSSSGGRSYPWRILKLTEKDSEIAEDNLIYALAEPAASDIDWSWVKPGFSAWEWWNDFGLEGTSFKPGINNETYKAYIDFAAVHGLEYMTIDEGWGKLGPGQNLLIPIPGLDLQGLADYAAQKGVRLILWAVFDRVAKDAENVCSKYEKMGIAGFKTDFFGRNDQQAVEMICRTAETAARHHMILDLHGSYPQMGLNRTYPNIVNTEGVTGLENCKWNSPEDDFMAHDATLAFLRQMAGPCDYTPGAMLNYSREEFRADFSHPGSQGTRAHQVALYGVLDSPLTMLCDSPSNYEKEPETTAWIASLPRAFTSKKVIDGRIGEFIIVARETPDGEWCLSGITSWNARQMEVSTSFLPEGQWHCEAFTDSDISSTVPQSYKTSSFDVDAGEPITVNMAPGGGFYLKFSKPCLLSRE